jgi:hypothetical protein
MCRACRGCAVGRGGWVSGVVWWLTGFWLRACACESAGESRAPAVAGGVDGGAYGRRTLVGGIDVAARTGRSLAYSRGNPRSGLPDRAMVTLLGAMFPLEGIVLEMDPVRETRGLRGYAAVDI